MKKKIQEMSFRLRVFMDGRYGYDELSVFLSCFSFLCLIISFIPHLKVFYLIGLVSISFTFYRSLSKNHYKRQAERIRFFNIKKHALKRISLAKNKLRDRKTHTYYSCPNCNTVVRIKKPPKGRNIMISCPKCTAKFNKRT